MLLEIIARVAKNELNTLLRDAMEKVSIPSSEPPRTVVAKYFRRLLQDAEYWKQDIKYAIQLWFPESLTERELKASYDLRGSFDMYKMFVRLQQLTCLKVRGTATFH